MSNTPAPIYDKTPLLEEADRLKGALRIGSSANTEASSIANLHFRTALAYSSTALDGLTLSESEVAHILKTGMTVGNKPLIEHNMVLGHARAFDYLLECTQNGAPELSEELLCHIHLLYCAGFDINHAGIYKEEQNHIEGTTYAPPSPKVTPMLMKTYINDMGAHHKSAYHPVEYATILHKRLLDIHPFSRGNGCTARLLMNLMLIAHGYGYCVIPPARKDDYMEAMRTAQLENNTAPLVCLVAGYLIDSQKIYARHAGVSV